jgi:Ca2+-binding RTX toxin-like protein
MAGGVGNDAYYVDDAGDEIIEADDEGTDTVWASVNYTLEADAEVESLRANAGTTGLTLTGNAFSRLIAGNLGDDTLIGGTGNDTLDGGASADAMAGGDGNDTYYVDVAADRVSEAAGEGTDTVWAGVSYTIGAGEAVEALRANAGTTGLTLTGNAFTRTIAGNAGDDTLIGGTGNSTLDGGAGADAMAGGAGNDIYYVDNTDDVVSEAAGEGTDTIWAGVSYTIGADAAVEFLRANAGTTGLTLTGNTFANTVVGGTGNDSLDGGPGADTLTGNGGNDILRFLPNFGQDVVTDFIAHAGPAGSIDLLDISGLGISAETFAAGVSIAAGPGRTTIITIGPNSISLRNVVPSDIDINDFRLA